MIFACSFSELYCQYVHEQHYGATEEAWRAVYQNPEVVTPSEAGRLSEHSGLNTEAPAVSRKVGQR